ncbi:MAG: hypothetical protein JOZ41_06755 [Chloroflexi bacterium]|nr:hypothetical protein [Chloroflexota bacterium]
MGRPPDDFYRYGEVYDALETCQQLELDLARLRRRGLLSREEWAACKERLDDVRKRLEAAIPSGRRRPIWRRLLDR